MLLVPSEATTPLTIDALLRVIAERDAEVALLKLMIDKLKLQLARRVREQYGRSSEQLDAQLTLITAEAPKACEARAAPPPRASRASRIASSASCPSTCRARRRSITPRDTQRDAPCACSECGGKLRQIGEDVLRAVGVRARALQGHPPCAPQARVHALRGHLPGAGARVDRSHAGCPGRRCWRT